MDIKKMPNIFQKIFGYFQRKSFLSVGQSLSFGDMIQRPTDKDFLDAFECSFLVNACVSKIAKKVASTEFKVYKVAGRAGKEKITEEKSHEVLDLLAQVNPYTTKFEMFELTQTYLELLGNAYWYKTRAKGGKKILELWPLRPDWVTIKQDETGAISKYEYRIPNGQTQLIETEDVIHFKQTNPKSFLYGLPTIKAVMDVVRTSIYATRWNMNFFNNSAVPDTLLITKTAMTSEQKKEFREKWESKYQGYKNAHKLGILEGEIELKQLMMSMRDMEFDKLTNTTTQQILTAFGVPKSILGIQGMNRAEAEAQIYAFLSETIEPKIRAIVESLNQFLIPEFGDNLFLFFNDPTPANREAKVKEYESGIKNNWLLINEVRDMEGLTPIEGGWDFYLPMSMIPVGGSGGETKIAKIKGTTEKEYKKHKEEKEQERLSKIVLDGKRSLKLKMQLKAELVKAFLVENKNKLPFTDEQKKSWWNEHNALLKSDERLFLVFVRKLFKNQEGRIKETLESELTGKNAKSIKKIDKVLDKINWDIENHIFFELAFPVFADITDRRGKRAGRLIGVEFEITEDVVEKINEKTVKFAEQVNDTTREKLKRELGEGVAAGEGVPKLTDRVSNVFRTRRKYESERIARTEVSSASNAAEFESYKQSKVIEKKEWLTTLDGSERPWHKDINAEVVGLNEKFSNGLMFPGDPAGPAEEVINCRCTTIPVVG